MTNLLTVDSLQDDINEENAQALTNLALKSDFWKVHLMKLQLWYSKASWGEF